MDDKQMHINIIVASADALPQMKCVVIEKLSPHRRLSESWTETYYLNRKLCCKEAK